MLIDTPALFAIADANRLTLVTHNAWEFSRVEGWMIEDWEAGELF